MYIESLPSALGHRKFRALGTHSQPSGLLAFITPNTISDFSGRGLKTTYVIKPRHVCRMPPTSSPIPSLHASRPWTYCIPRSLRLDITTLHSSSYLGQTSWMQHLQVTGYLWSSSCLSINIFAPSIHQRSPIKHVWNGVFSFQMLPPLQPTYSPSKG